MVTDRPHTYGALLRASEAVAAPGNDPPSQEHTGLSRRYCRCCHGLGAMQAPLWSIPFPKRCNRQNGTCGATYWSTRILCACRVPHALHGRMRTRRPPPYPARARTVNGCASGRTAQGVSPPPCCLGSPLPPLSTLQSPLPSSPERKLAARYEPLGLAASTSADHRGTHTPHNRYGCGQTAATAGSCSTRVPTGKALPGKDAQRSPPHIHVRRPPHRKSPVVTRRRKHTR